MNDFALELPINSVSFGQVSICILRELYKRGVTPSIFPIGNIDLSPYQLEKPMIEWITNCLQTAQTKHNRDIPVIKLWHLNGAISSVSNKQILFTFHETSEVTPTETNIINNQYKVLVSSKYTQSVLSNDKVVYCPLGFDTNSFKQTNQDYVKDSIVFGLYGKLEPNRKRHLKILSAWAKRFGNKREYMLHCALFNPFMNPSEQQNLISSALNRQKYYNINFIPFVQTNELYNQVLNSANIVIGMGTESWGLPEFQSLCLGKHAVLLNCHGYKEYANNKNTVFVEPNGVIIANDGLFFKSGSQFNQGSFFDFDENDLISACEIAINRFKNNPINSAGLELRKQFTYSETVDIILKNL